MLLSVQDIKCMSINMLKSIGKAIKYNGIERAAIMHTFWRHLFHSLCGWDVYSSGPGLRTKQELDFLHFAIATLLYLTSVELGKKNRCEDRQYLEKVPEQS